MNRLCWDVRDFGAVPDGKTICTSAIQSAVDACHEAGGGRVIIAGGSYKTGAIRLSSHVTLVIENGACLDGSVRYEDYLYNGMMNRSSIGLVYAIDAENVGVEGDGCMEGHGGPEFWPNAGDQERHRPRLVYFERCKGVALRNITLLHPACFTACFYHCVDVICSGVRIDSVHTPNGDGIDFYGGENVVISDCIIEAGDDCISLKAVEKDDICKNFAISNCIMTTQWAAIRLGAEGDADMREIVMTNCVFDCCGDGFKIQNCGYSIYENIQFSQIVMRNVARPFFVTLNTWSWSELGPIRPPIGAMRNIQFRDITAAIQPDPKFDIVSDKNPCFAVLGFPGKPMEDITFSNISITMPGGSADIGREDIPEMLDYFDLWPEPQHFKGIAPGSCIFLRHLRNCVFENITLRLESPDARPFIYAQDVCDSEFIRVKARGDERTGGLFRLFDCNGLTFERNVLYNADAPQIMENTTEQTARYEAFKDCTCELEEMLAEEAAQIDAARRMGIFAELRIEELTRSVDEAANATVYKGALPVDKDARPMDKDARPQYMFFPWVRGNIEVLINGESVAKRIMPESYQWRYCWAFDIGAFIDKNKDNTLEIRLSGAGADLLSQPQIRSSTRPASIEEQSRSAIRKLQF